MGNKIDEQANIVNKITNDIINNIINKKEEKEIEEEESEKGATSTNDIINKTEEEKSEIDFKFIMQLAKVIRVNINKMNLLIGTDRKKITETILCSLDSFYRSDKSGSFY